MMERRIFMQKMNYKTKINFLLFICFTLSCVAVLLYVIMIPKEIAIESVKNKFREETITIIPISKKEMTYNSLKIFFLFNMPTCAIFFLKLKHRKIC